MDNIEMWQINNKLGEIFCNVGMIFLIIIGFSFMLFILFCIFGVLITHIKESINEKKVNKNE